MKKHTPAPWEVHPPDFKNHAVVTTSRGDWIFYGSGDSREDLANAELVAAAPEMLIALELALEQLEPIPAGKAKLIQEPAFALKAVRYAIAKAKGKL